MSVPPASSGGEAGRVRCLYCGANNFPASTTCWQCGRPLQAARAVPSSASPSPAPASPAISPFVSSASSRAASTNAVNPALAGKAAAMLGLMFPYIGLPVGIVFLMLDDPRKTQLGWAAIGWSVAGTVLNGLALAATVGPTLSVLRGLIPTPGGHSPLPTLPDPSGGMEILLPLFSLLRDLLPV